MHQLEFDKVCDKHNHLRTQMTAMKDRVDEAQAEAHKAQTVSYSKDMLVEADAQLHLQLEDMKVERAKMRASLRREVSMIPR